MTSRFGRRSPARANLTATVAVTAALCLGLSACGGTSSSGDSSGGGEAGYDADSKTITIGNLHALSGPLSSGGLAMTTGLSVYLEELNAEGGINGEYRVELLSEDTEYNPQLAVPLYNRVKNDVAMFATIFGTPSINTLLPQLQADNYLVVNASNDGNFLRNPNLIVPGVSTQVNMINLAAYAAEELAMQDAVFCSVTVNDDYGKSNDEGIEYAVDALGLDFESKVLVESTPAASYTAQIQQLQGDGCEAVFLGTTIAQVPGIMAAAAQLGFEGQWLGSANTWDPASAEAAYTPYMEEHYLTAALGVNWDSEVEGLTNLRAALEEHAPDATPGPYLQVGYAWGYLVEAILTKAIENGDVTPAGIVAASQELGEVDYQGIYPSATYGPAEDRQSPVSTSVYKADHTVPMGLALVEADYASPAAAEYEED